MLLTSEVKAVNCASWGVWGKKLCFLPADSKDQEGSNFCLLSACLSFLSLHIIIQTFFWLNATYSGKCIHFLAKYFWLSFIFVFPFAFKHYTFTRNSAPFTRTYVLLCPPIHFFIFFFIQLNISSWLVLIPPFYCAIILAVKKTLSTFGNNPRIISFSSAYSNFTIETFQTKKKVCPNLNEFLYFLFSQGYNKNYKTLH